MDKNSYKQAQKIHLLPSLFLSKSQEQMAALGTNVRMTCTMLAVWVWVNFSWVCTLASFSNIHRHKVGRLTLELCLSLILSFLDFVAKHYWHQNGFALSSLIFFLTFLIILLCHILRAPKKENRTTPWEPRAGQSLQDLSVVCVCLSNFLSLCRFSASARKGFFS